MTDKAYENLSKELQAINDEFHLMIEKHDHCYNRDTDHPHQRCDCEHYYAKWVETKINSSK